MHNISCSSMLRGWKSLLLQCLTRKRGTRTLLLDILFLLNCATYLHRTSAPNPLRTWSAGFLFLFRANHSSSSIGCLLFEFGIWSFLGGEDVGLGFLGGFFLRWGELKSSSVRQYIKEGGNGRLVGSQRRDISHGQELSSGLQEIRK